MLEFGKRMQQVSTTGPAEIAAKEIKTAYKGLVDPKLLDAWAAAPSTAPGKRASSPWPDRIEIESSSNGPDDEVIVTGRTVERTSTGDAGSMPVRIVMHTIDGEWVIVRFDATSDDDGRKAVEVIHDYYAAIAAHDYKRAYGLWGSSGPPGQSMEKFAAGFADTASVRVETGTPSRIGAAAGSRYIDVPVTIVAKTTSGVEQRFTGTYTLRRAVVDGAPASERSWHLYRAELRPM